MPVARKRAGSREVHTVQAIGPGADPQHAACIAPQAHQVIAAQAVRIIGIVHEVLCFAGARVEVVEPGSMQAEPTGGDPERPILCFVDGSNIITGKTFRVGFVVLVADKCTGGWLEAVQTGPFDAVRARADPQLTV